MGTLLSIPASFVKSTRAKAAEVNAKFSDIYSALADGSRDHYINALRFKRLVSVNATVSDSDCHLLAAPIIGAGITYDVATSTGMLIALESCQILTTGVISVGSGASFVVL
jgi:hypothetical protein